MSICPGWWLLTLRHISLALGAIGLGISMVGFCRYFRATYHHDPTEPDYFILRASFWMSLNVGLISLSIAMGSVRHLIEDAPPYFMDFVLPFLGLGAVLGQRYWLKNENIWRNLPLGGRDSNSQQTD